ncbi:MAG: hypothetical protein JST26_07965 [Bacteroidetes bacterium]|nr:hypothetical protein [Bacteroidota bacterium]
MSLIHKYIIWFGAGLFGIVNVFAQTPQDDMIRMNKKIILATAYDVELEMKIYKDEHDAKPLYSYNGHTCRDGNKYFVSMMDRITLISENTVLLVDKRQHMILYRPMDKNNAGTPSMLSGLNVDSLVKSVYQNVVYVSNTSDLKVIEIRNPGGDFKSIRFSIDAKTDMLKELVYVYSDEVKKNTQNARAVISFKSIKLGAVKDPVVFSDKQYISRKGKKVNPIGLYKAYKLVDQSEIVIE